MKERNPIWCKRISDSKSHDLTGKKFNMITVIRRDRGQKFKRPVWICKCECGTIKSIRAGNLRMGSVKSCGCLLRLNGEKHSAWKGGKTLKDGYVIVSRRINGKRMTIPEHRLVMEKRLGRPLLKNENVHHKNGNK